ncbi:MAG TPA: hypothetical protein VL754_15790 [Verrucomicrobiae bacterium]|nr:hypothetical protein [Verrucomicrobiae bacterium]
MSNSRIIRRNPWKELSFRGDLTKPDLFKNPEWPSNSAATRSLRQKTWTVVLRCRACQRRFAVKRVTLDRLALAPQVLHCVFCGAQPHLSSDTPAALHQIVDMREDVERE